jgi:hypothetical protein
VAGEKKDRSGVPFDVVEVSGACLSSHGREPSYMKGFPQPSLRSCVEEVMMRKILV